SSDLIDGIERFSAFEDFSSSSSKILSVWKCLRGMPCGSRRRAVAMTYPIAKRITFNLVAEVIVAVVTVMLAIGWMANRQNEQAQRTTHTMVLGGIAGMEETVKAFANDYAWWEPGYEHYVAKDAEWIDVNFGSGIVDTQITDVLLI